MARTLIVGDVHGCLDELRALVKACDYRNGDRLLFVGDLVAKGPDSQGVVQFAREHAASCVLGNHEAHVLKFRNGKTPGPNHLKVAQSLTEADWLYLEELPLHFVLEPFNTVVVHAGLVPGVALEKQSREHQLTLRSFDGDDQPTSRVVGAPWASRWPGPQRIVFGHDAIRGLQKYPHALGLDTGCVYGRELTALVLPENRLVSVQAKRAYAGTGGD